MSEPLLGTGLPRPVPQADGLDAPFFAGLEEGELRLQCCRDCGVFQMPFEWVCHRCLGRSLAFVKVAPEGLIYSYTRIHHASHPALGGHVPYVALLVELPAASRIRLVGNLLGDPMQPVAIGARVEGVFERGEGCTLLQWRRAG